MVAKFKEAVFEEAEKVITAFVTWGLGILFMVAYCVFILWLSKIHLYLMIAGALLFLAVSFFFIDLWWSVSKGRGA